MKKQFEERINALKAEFEAGQKMMAELEAKRSSLETTMLRISGAIQILEELVARTDETSVGE